MPRIPQHASVMDPMSLTLANIYAQSLMESSSGIDETVVLNEQLQGIVGVLDRSAGAAALLTAALLSTHQRGELVKRIFSGRVEGKIQGLLFAMAHNDRLMLLRDVARCFDAMLQKLQGKVEVDLITAFELDAAQQEQLRKTIQEALGAEPVFRTKVDKDILGGVVLRIDDKVYDASLAAELDRLKKQVKDRIMEN